MYARRQTRPKPRKSQVKKWGAPVQGWISNRALANPVSMEGQGAAVLDNFFPQATSVILRRGRLRYATFEDTSLTVTALFTYRNGGNERLFGANENVIYDLTSIVFADGGTIVDDDGDDLVTDEGDTFGWGSTLGLDVASGYTGGDWITAQFATTGGVYLIGVNGTDPGFIYDGDGFYPYVDGGLARLDYVAEASPFMVGQIVEGGTSGATATIARVVDEGGGEGHLFVHTITGTFVNGETLTDGLTGEAEADGSTVPTIPGPTFPNGLTSADMAFVWVYKNRLWFAQTSSMNAWFLTEPDAVGGDLDVFPLAGVFGQGGSLLFGSAWSLESSGDGGLSEQCVFVSSIGEVAVYQGTDPQEAATWSKVGLYQVGKPLGRKAFFRGGGDLAIATTVGLVPLSKAISLDITALNVATVSYKIADAWTEAVRTRGSDGWQCQLWSEGKMALISPPDEIGAFHPVAFVSNTETGAWARYTNWDMRCIEVFRGILYFGSTEGRVYIGNVSGADDGETYSGAVVPLFEDMDTPAQAKIGTVTRARARGNATLRDNVSMLADFSTTLPVPPDATGLTGGNLWDVAVWGTAKWGQTTPTVLSQPWKSAGGIGYSLSVCYQVTSGDIAALDAELIDLELLFTVAEAVT